MMHVKIPAKSVIKLSGFGISAGLPSAVQGGESSNMTVSVM